jgi:hypothetical protein
MHQHHTPETGHHGSQLIMRTVSVITSLVWGSLCLSSQLAWAEVFKCTTADGKTSYSQSPCAAENAKEAVVPIVAAPKTTAPVKGKDWAAENAAIDARLRAAAQPQDTASSAPAKPTRPKKSRQQIVAECEASHGINCSSAEEIARREMEERELSPDEDAARDKAAAGRRENIRKAEAAAKEKAKPKK